MPATRPPLRCLSAIVASTTWAIGAAHGDIISYEAILNSASVSPPNPSPAAGYARLDFNTAAHTVRVRINFSGLLGPSTQCAVHAPTQAPGAGNIGVAFVAPFFLGFPQGVAAGEYETVVDLASPSVYNASFFVFHGGGNAATAEAAVLTFMEQGQAYLPVHSSVFPGGEIRGFFIPVAPCSPDCNGDDVLNLSDFGCFTTKFALGDAYADCNGDGVRNLSDFGCFTTKFALGCP